MNPKQKALENAAKPILKATAKEEKPILRVTEKPSVKIVPSKYGEGRLASSKSTALKKLSDNI